MYYLTKLKKFVCFINDTNNLICILILNRIEKILKNRKVEFEGIYTYFSTYAVISVVKRVHRIVF